MFNTEKQMTEWVGIAREEEGTTYVLVIKEASEKATGTTTILSIFRTNSGVIWRTDFLSRRYSFCQNSGGRVRRSEDGRGVKAEENGWVEGVGRMENRMRSEKRLSPKTS